MLPKHSRLTKQTIEKSLIRARRLKTSSFLVMYAIEGAKGRPQVSFTLSKKVAPTAVARNKARRRGYSAVRSLIPRLSPGAIILVSYVAPLTKATIPEMTAELESVFKKAGLLK